MLKRVNLKKLQELKNYPDSGKPENYIDEGGNAVCRFLPQNIHVWMTQHDLSREPVKKHHRYVLKVILKGHNVSRIDGQDIILPQGKAILLFPFQEHSNLPSENNNKCCETLIINFIEYPVNSGALQPLLNHVMDIEDSDAFLLEKMFKGCRFQDGQTPSDAVCALIWFLTKQVERATFLPVTHNPTEDESLFSRINSYIQKNMDSHISLKTLETEFNVSKSTLRRIFRKKSNISTPPGKLIRNMKLYKAAEWVQCSSNSIEEIATWCGYSDQFAFSRAFKKHFAMSPMKMRMLKNKPRRLSK